MYIVSKDYPRASDAQCPPTLRPTCTQLPTPSRHRHRLQTCTDPPSLTHMTPPAHLPTLTSPRCTCAPPTLTLALVLTCPCSQRRCGGDDAMTIATAPSSWRRSYHPLSRSLRAHPVRPPPPLALATHMRAARRRPPHGAPAQPNECPCACPSLRSQCRHGDNDAVTIAAARLPWRCRHHPPSPSHPPHPGPGPHPTSPPVVHPGMPACPPSPVRSSPPGLTVARTPSFPALTLATPTW
jgi:hypothetical protein